jgi:prostaglandin-endoperoxide synthase 2
MKYDNRAIQHGLKNYELLWRLAGATPWLRSFTNRKIINFLTTRGEARPHPLSLWSPQAKATDPTKPREPEAYVSWTGLVDRAYTGRHLPPTDKSFTCPPPQDIEALFPRKGAAIPCAKSTALFGFFAQWFTDSFLRTDPGDFRFNTSNHEIDLCQIYGLCARDTDILRSHVGGKLRTNDKHAGFPPFLFDEEGKRVRKEFEDLSYIDKKTGDYLHADVLQDPAFNTPERKKRLFATGLERGNTTILYSAINTVFLREHNLICDLLAAAHKDWDDDRLFETARNVSIVQLLHIVIEDYINHISPIQFRKFLEPGFAEREPWYRTNRICAEFNLLYRWHQLVPGEIRIGDDVVDAKRYRFNNELLLAPGALEKVLEAASTQGAGRITLENSAPFLVPADAAALKKSRQWKIRTYNEYRQHFKLKPVRSYERLTRDPDLAARLRAAYGPDVNQVELMVGLLAEECDRRSVLGDLMTVMVAVDAFSQALTNPLVATRVHGAATFSAEGLDRIRKEGRNHTFAALARGTTDIGDRCVNFSQQRLGGGFWPGWLCTLWDTADFLWFSGWERFFRKREGRCGSTIFRANLFKPTIFMLEDRAIAPLFASPAFDQDKPSDTFQFQIPPLPLLGDVVPAMFESGKAHDGPKALYLEVLRERSPQFVARFDEVFAEYSQEWTKGVPLSFTPDLENFVASFVFRWILDTNVQPQPVRDFFNNMFGHWMMPVTKYLPGSAYRRACRLHKELVAEVHGSPGFARIAQLAPAHGVDLADLDKLFTYVMGNNMYLGIQSVLKSVIGELGRHPTWTEALREELDAADLGGDDATMLRKLNALPLLDGWMREVLRLHPPVFLVSGRANRDIVLESRHGAFFVAKGEFVTGVVPLAQRDPKAFSDPESFNPRRYDNSDELNRLSWPRGRHAGTVVAADRTCAGKDPAVWAAKLFCARMLLRFDWKLRQVPRWEKRKFPLNVAAPIGELAVENIWPRRRPSDEKPLGSVKQEAISRP